MLRAVVQYVAVWLPLVVAGIVLIRAGWRGRRVNDHPICRGCGFDLVGLGGVVGVGGEADGLPARCPECGRDLAGAKRVRHGARRRRPWIIATGMLLLLAGLGTGGWLTYKPLAKFPWTTWAPDWALAEMVDSGNTAQADLVMRELLQRIRLETLSNQATKRAVDKILRAQGDTAVTWRPVWGNFVEMARRRKLVGDEQWKQYARQSTITTCQFRDVNEEGNVIAWLLKSTFRVGSNQLFLATQPIENSPSPFGIRVETKALRVDDREISGSAGPSFSTKAMNNAASISAIRAIPPVEFARGQHHGEVTFEVTIYENVRLSPDEVADDPVLVSWVESIPFTFQVVGPGEAGIVLRTDASLREAVKASLEGTRFRPVKEWDGDAIKADIRVIGNPLPMTFDVEGIWTRDDGSSERLNFNSISLSANSSSTYMCMSEPVSTPATGGTLTLTLRPSVEVALRTVYMMEIWGEEIVLEGIPFEPNDKGW